MNDASNHHHLSPTPPLRHSQSWQITSTLPILYVCSSNKRAEWWHSSLLFARCLIYVFVSCNVEYWAQAILMLGKHSATEPHSQTCQALLMGKENSWSFCLHTACGPELCPMVLPNFRVKDWVFPLSARRKLEKEGLNWACTDVTSSTSSSTTLSTECLSEGNKKGLVLKGVYSWSRMLQWWAENGRMAILLNLRGRGFKQQSPSKTEWVVGTLNIQTLMV